MNNKPKQLKRIRQEFYDKAYARQPQLMDRLNPFFAKADIIEAHTEPPLISTKKRTKVDKKAKIKNEFREKLNTFRPQAMKNKVTRKKVSMIREDVLWNLR